MFDDLLAVGARLGGVLVVLAVLFVALASVASVADSAGGLLFLLAALPLWVIGRSAWKRRAEPVRGERPKPRRRALPPPPDAGERE